MKTLKQNLDRVVEIALEEFPDVPTPALVVAFKRTIHMLVDDSEGQRRRVETLFACRLAEARCADPVKFLDRPIASDEDRYLEQQMQHMAMAAEEL